MRWGSCASPVQRRQTAPQRSIGSVPHGWPYGYLTELRRRPIGAEEVATLTHSYPDGGPRLITHLALQEGDEVVQGRNPSIRPAKEDDGQVDKHKRVFTMLRRRGGKSVFASVLEPVTGDAQVAGVRRLDVQGAEMALEVELASGRRDLVLLEPREVEMEWQGAALTADAELGYVSTGGPAMMAVGGTVRWGEASVEAPVLEHRLLAVDRDARAVIVEGALSPAVGSVITVDHAGGRVSAYEVEAAETKGDSTTIKVAQDPGFEWGAEAATSTFVFVPHTSYAGEHVVRQRALKATH